MMLGIDRASLLSAAGAATSAEVGGRVPQRRCLLEVGCCVGPGTGYPGTGPYLDGLPGSGKDVTPFLIGCCQTPVRDKIDTGDRISDLHARRYPVVGQAVRSSQIFCHISRDKPTVSVKIR
jgi:hypothetical protein